MESVYKILDVNGEKKTYVTLAIDFGAYKTVAGYYKGEVLQFIKDDGQESFFPSAVAFLPEKRQPLAGRRAKIYGLEHPTKTVTSFKRLMGKKYDSDIVAGKDAKYMIKKGSDGNCLVAVKDRGGNIMYFTPETISSFLFQKIKAEAERQANAFIQNVIISVPTDFNESAREAIITAAEISGLNVIRLVTVPTSCTFVFSSTLSNNANTNLLVLDIGSEAFEISIVNISKYENGMIDYQFLGTAGNSSIGGNNFDESIIGFVKAKLLTKYLKDCHDDGSKHKDQVEEENKNRIQTITSVQMEKIKEKVLLIAERTKIQLCTEKSAEIEIHDLLPGVDFCETMTEQAFELLNKTKFSTIMAEIDELLKCSKLNRADIGDVMLVGGTSQIPKLGKLFTEYFQKPPKSFSPKLDVMKGCAIVAAQYDENPSFISGGFSLKDALPYDIGLKDANNEMIVIVKRNSKLPYEGVFQFKTAIDGQKKAKIRVYEGNNKEVKYNQKLGEIQLRKMKTKTGEKTPVRISVNVCENSGMIRLTASEVWGNKSKSASFDRYFAFGFITKDLAPDEYACKNSKNDLQAICVDYKNKLDQVAAEGKVVEGFGLRCEKFKQYANETIKWLHGPMRNRIKMDDLIKKRLMVCEYFNSTRTNQDWIEPKNILSLDNIFDDEKAKKFKENLTGCPMKRKQEPKEKRSSVTLQ